MPGIRHLRRKAAGRRELGYLMQGFLARPIWRSPSGALGGAPPPRGFGGGSPAAFPRGDCLGAPLGAPPRPRRGGVSVDGAVRRGSAVVNVMYRVGMERRRGTRTLVRGLKHIAAGKFRPPGMHHRLRERPPYGHPFRLAAPDTAARQPATAARGSADSRARPKAPATWNQSGSAPRCRVASAGLEREKAPPTRGAWCKCTRYRSFGQGDPHRKNTTPPTPPPKTLRVTRRGHSTARTCRTVA